MHRVERSLTPRLAILGILLGSSALLLNSCALFQKSVEGQYVAAIGRDGGTLDTGVGASITIPGGALKKTVDIQINPFLTPEELPEYIGELIFDDYSVVEFLPDGLEFEEPVTITLPAVRELTPGDQIPLYLWNAEEAYWETTDLIATVNEDGRSYSAEVSHFSSWSGGSEGSESGRFGTFDPSDTRCEEQLVDIQFDNWISDIEHFVAHTGKGYPKPGCCVVETGYEASFIYRDSTYCPDGIKGIVTVGTLGDVEEWPEPLVNEASTASMYIFQKIQIFRGRAAPDVRLIRPDCIDLFCVNEKKEKIGVDVNCGSKLDPVGVPGAQIEWNADGEGSVDPTMMFTDSGGSAETTLTVNDKGLSMVSATAMTCQGTEDYNTQRVSHMICIDACKKMQLILDMSFSHSGGDVPWKINDQITAIVEYTVDKETGRITSDSGIGSQRVSVSSVTEHCSATGIQAPNFSLKIENGYATESQTHVQLMAESLPVNFTMHCEYPTMDEPVEVPVPPYASLFGSILGKYLDLDIPGHCASQAYEGYIDGSGSEGFGESPPIEYEYKVNLLCIERECKICE